MNESMKDQANQILLDILQNTVEAADTAVEFSKAQIPDIVEQLLMWHLVESLAPMSILFTASGVSAFLSWKCFKAGGWYEVSEVEAKRKNPEYNPNTDSTETEVVGLFFVGAFVCFFVWSLL